MTQQKNYIGFLNDNSGSMATIASAALKDYNANVNAVKEAATKNMQDTVVSSFGFGRNAVTREVVNSNPHVLQPLTHWKAIGGTPGRSAIKAMIDMFKSLPDYDNPSVAFVVFATTDGEFDSWDSVSKDDLAREIAALVKTERWTFVFRVPRGGRRYLSGLNIPEGNIQEWDTTAAGMAVSTQATSQAFDTFYATRAAGKTSSTVFYANATGVNTAALTDISAKVSLYVVDAADEGIQIRDFILKHRMEYLKGSAFYQLTKSESKVAPSKMIAIRDRNTGKVYAGKDARDQLGLSTVNNIRLHPGDHGNFDLFIQSESVNRKLVGRTGVLYWKEIGKPFTDADLAYLLPKATPKPVVPAKPAVVVLPKVAVTNKPTPSPIPVTKQAPAKPTPILPSDGGRVRFYTAPAGAIFYPTRDRARSFAMVQGKKSYDAGPTAARGKRFYAA